MIRGIIIIVLGVIVIILRLLLDSKQRMKDAKKTKGTVVSTEKTDNTIKYYIQFENEDGDVMHSYTVPYKKTDTAENAVKDGDTVRIRYSAKKYFSGKMDVVDIEIIDKRLEKYSSYGSITVAGLVIIAFGVFNVVRVFIK